MSANIIEQVIFLMACILFVTSIAVYLTLKNNDDGDDEVNSPVCKAMHYFYATYIIVHVAYFSNYILIIYMSVKFSKSMSDNYKDKFDL